MQCIDACCSSCDIKDKRDFNSKEAVKLLIQAVLDLGQLQTYKEGVKEEVLIGWLRGSKKDTFSARNAENHEANADIFRWYEDF